MPENRYDNNYASRLLIRIAVVLCPLILVLILAIRQASSSSLMSFDGYILMGVGATLLIVGTVWVFRLYSHYRCRECGELLPANLLATSAKNYPRYYCQSCDIVWTTEPPVPGD